MHLTRSSDNVNEVDALASNEEQQPQQIAVGLIHAFQNVPGICSGGARPKRKLDERYASLATVWNRRCLRLGDMVRDVMEDEDRMKNHHADQWSISGLLRTAWRNVGRGWKAGGVHIDGSRHALGPLSLVASVIPNAHNKKNTERLDVNAANSAGINVFQLYDATPLKMWFGALQAESASVASYFILSGDRWQRVSFEQYEKKNPRAKVRYGTWELFAQRAQCNCARQSGEHYTIEKQQVACLPVIAEACNASVMWSAMMGACGSSFSVDAINDLADKKRWVVCAEAPDGHKANKRLQAQLRNRSRGNVLKLLRECGGHIRHTTTVSSTREVELETFMLSPSLAASQLNAKRI